MKRVKTFEKYSDSSIESKLENNVSTKELYDKLKPGNLTPREITNTHFKPLIYNIQELDSEIGIRLVTYYIGELKKYLVANKYNL